MRERRELSVPTEESQAILELGLSIQEPTAAGRPRHEKETGTMELLHQCGREVEEQIKKYTEEVQHFHRAPLLQAHNSSIGTQTDPFPMQRNYHLLQHDNDMLRAKIARMCNPREPLRDEDTYKTDFEVLNRKIESWIARQVKRTPLESFTADRQNEFLEILDSFQNHSPDARASLTYLKRRISTISQKRPTRIAFFRFLIGVFVYQHVLAPYAFGLSPEASAICYSIQDHIQEQGQSKI
jgi:hypothetical protein